MATLFAPRNRHSFYHRAIIPRRLRPYFKGSDTMKCLVTDTGCMKEAKAQRKKVEIVEEHQLDTLRCSMIDTDCLTRAKAMGKKVDIID